MIRADIMDVVRMKQILLLVAVVLATMVPTVLASDECMAERIDPPPDTRRPDRPAGF